MRNKIRKMIAWYFLPKDEFWDRLEIKPGKVIETMGEFSQFRNDLQDHRRILDALLKASGPLLLKVQPEKVVSDARRKASVQSIRILEVIDTTQIFLRFKHLCLINALKFVQGLYFQDKGKLALLKQRLLNLANGRSGFTNPAEEIRHLTAVTAEIVASSLAMDVMQGLPPDIPALEKEEQWTRTFAVAYEALSRAQVAFLVRLISEITPKDGPEKGS